MTGGFMYLVVIIDWYSRYIVSWELSSTLERGFMLRALRKTIASRKPKIINSDQGAHFTCGNINLLKEHEIQISMDGKDHATDNAITESFFLCAKGQLWRYCWVKKEKSSLSIFW
jgi:putative transposase